VSPDETQRPAPDAPALPATVSPAWRRGLVAFGRFWWDFLVGETPELLVGSVVAVGGAALLIHAGAVRAVVVGSLPVLVVAILALSALRARARGRLRSEDER